MKPAMVVMAATRRRLGRKERALPRGETRDEPRRTGRLRRGRRPRGRNRASAASNTATRACGYRAPHETRRSRCRRGGPAARVTAARDDDEHGGEERRATRCHATFPRRATAAIGQIVAAAGRGEDEDRNDLIGSARRQIRRSDRLERIDRFSRSNTSEGSRRSSGDARDGRSRPAVPVTNTLSARSFRERVRDSCRL